MKREQSLRRRFHVSSQSEQRMNKSQCSVVRWMNPPQQIQVRMLGFMLTSCDIGSEIITIGAGNEIMHQIAALLRGRVIYLRAIISRVASTERRKETMLILNSIYEALAARDAYHAEKLTRAYVQRSAEFAKLLMNHCNSRGSQT